MSHSQQPWSDVDGAIAHLMQFIEDRKLSLDDVAVGGSLGLTLQGFKRFPNDINLWVEAKAFAKLCEDTQTINHALVDTVIKLPAEGIYIRQWVKWFEVDNIDGINVFKPLSLITFKRGGYANPLRPLAKRVQDKIDIAELSDFMAYKNRVRHDVA